MVDIDTENGLCDPTSGSCGTIPSTSASREDRRVAPEKTLNNKDELLHKSKWQKTEIRIFETN